MRARRRGDYQVTETAELHFQRHSSMQFAAERSTSLTCWWVCRSLRQNPSVRKCSAINCVWCRCLIACGTKLATQTANYAQSLMHVMTSKANHIRMSHREKKLSPTSCSILTSSTTDDDCEQQFSSVAHCLQQLTTAAVRRRSARLTATAVIWHQSRTGARINIST